MMINKSVVSDRLRELRKSKGYTQNELANLLSVSYEGVNNWEREKTLPKHEILARLASLYQVSIDYILGQTNTRQRY